MFRNIQQWGITTAAQSVRITTISISGRDQGAPPSISARTNSTTEEGRAAALVEPAVRGERRAAQVARPA
jgi:hypothetical protein